MPLTNPLELKLLLQRHKFSFSKSLGQNFLIDETVLQKILDASGLDSTLCALEIGPGAGTLTQRLAKNAKKVVAVEIDSALLPVLDETMAGYENFKLVHADILKTDLSRLTQEEFGSCPFIVVANLPYYITTPIVMDLLESDLPVRSLTLMVQKEVAQRMTAQNDSKDYGALSVAVQYHTHPELVCKAEPHCFFPQPKVSSSVIHLEVLPAPAVNVQNEKFFFQIVKSAFGQRRKTLVNALSKSPYISVDKNAVMAALGQMNLSPTIRGEKLNLSQFAELTDLLEAKLY